MDERIEKLIGERRSLERRASDVRARCELIARKKADAERSLAAAGIELKDKNPEDILKLAETELQRVKKEVEACERQAGEIERLMDALGKE